MNPVTHIRQTVFGCETQEAFAVLLGTTQASVSRWEASGRIPGPRQEGVKQAAKNLGLQWDDRWFFEAPEAHEPAPEPARATE